MKISIIIVCLNAKDTIENTFTSIFNQTYKNFEVIVIDGMSNDGTLDIINNYHEKISYFISEPDNGIYHAMNKGIEAASGDFLIFLNADDSFYDESVLDKAANALIENKESKILFGDAIYLSNNKKSFRVSFNNIKNDLSLIFNNICHQSIFYHGSLFKAYGKYNLNYTSYSDWDFNIKCMMQNRVLSLYLPFPIANFSLNGISSSKNSKKICKKEKNCLINRYYPKLRMLLKINDSIRRIFPAFYKIIAKNKLVQKAIRLYNSDKKHLLNIKTFQLYTENNEKV